MVSWGTAFGSGGGTTCDRAGHGQATTIAITSTKPLVRLRSMRKCYGAIICGTTIFLRPGWYECTLCQYLVHPLRWNEKRPNLSTE